MQTKKETSPATQPKVVLVTGASSGIGRATALRFARSGHIVYGTSRSPRTLEGIRMLCMDVCDETSVEKAIQQILNAHGRLDILVANAGTGIAGSVEETAHAEAQSQFETNYFGALRTIRRVLPQMRDQGGGCIIGVSSVAAALSIPFQAGYSASKAALDATLAALRGEVRPFGIRVSIVAPGDTKTGFTDARRKVHHDGADSPYHERFSRSLARMEKDERNGVSPDKVAAVIHRVANQKQPPVRVAVGADYRLLLLLARLLPDRLAQWILERMYAS